MEDTIEKEPEQQQVIQQDPIVSQETFPEPSVVVIETLDSQIDSHEVDDKKRKLEQGPESQDQKTKRVKPNKEKPKKYALCLCYVGTNFQGMQVNPGNVTIELDLLNALDTVGAITTKNTKDKHNLEWHRACRTDKGVHAVRNIVTAKLLPLIADQENFASLVNEKLSPDIRLIVAQRVDNYFNPKNFCKRRTYLYFMPTWILSKSKKNIVKEDLEKFNRILGRYVGTRMFHNFTTKMKPTDPSVQRQIIKCQSSEPMIYDEDKEYVLVTVYGNSFMLHQIRKMMGLAIAIMREKCDETIFDSVFDTKLFVKTPEAPGHCLVLDRPEFSGYNRQQEGHNFFKPLTFEKFEEEIETYKKNVIFPEIVRIDKEKFEFADWIFLLDHDQHGHLKIVNWGETKSEKTCEKTLPETLVDEENKK